MSGEENNKPGSEAEGEEENKPTAIDIDSLTDEEISNLDPAEFTGFVEESTEGEGDQTPAPEGEESDGEAADQGSEGDADGTATDGSASEADDGETDSTSTDGEAEAGEQSPFDGDASKGSEDDQSDDKPADEKPAKGTDDDSVDYKVEYKKLMAPFRAANREISLDNIEDARRLMQMGVDYSRKMETMKPHLRVIRTLEKAGLTDLNKINFLIDLDKNDPAAIKKLLKDNDIDPMSLDMKEGGDYSPNDHTIGDTELAVTTVLKSLEGSPSFDRTMTVISDELDTRSKSQLQDNPALIATINEHIETGIYDKIMNKVADEKLFGRLAGMSDLDAYYQVGAAIHEAGGFNIPSEDEPAPGKKSTQAASSSGSAAEKAELQKRKRAALSTKGKATKTGKKVINISALSDEQIEKMDLSSLN